MPRKLTDVEVARLRELDAAGRDRDDLAAEFGITRRHVNRLVRGDQRQTITSTDGRVVDAVEAFLAGLELDDGDGVLAASALVLAAKLDAVKSSDAAAAATAAPGLVRQLSDTLRELRGEQDDGAAVALRAMLAPLLGGAS
jgi:hypothetical protein